MTTTIPPAGFSDATDGWSEPEIELGLQPVDADDQGDPDDDPAGAAPPPAYDPEAPYGRFKNGKPKKAPRRTAKSSGPKRVPAPRRTAAKKPPAAKKAAGPDYFKMSGDMVMEGVGILGVVAKITKSPALMADTVTLDLHAGNLADISAEFAEEEPRWAQMLERITSVSRWNKPLTIGIAIFAQAAVNHGMLPPGIMGSRPPAELLEIAEQRAKAAAAADAAEDRPSDWETAEAA